MRRRMASVALAALLGAATTGLAGLIQTRAATLPPVCVTQPIGPTQLEVGYCPNGPTKPLVRGL